MVHASMQSAIASITGIADQATGACRRANLHLFAFITPVNLTQIDSICYLNRQTTGRRGYWYDAAMIVINSSHEPAIVVRRDGHTVVFVRFKAGKLGCERSTENTFREQWHEANYPLDETLERFIQHGLQHGASLEAMKGLEKLRTRERCAIGSLF